MRSKIRIAWLAGTLVLGGITYYGGLRQGLSQIDADRKALMASFESGEKPYRLQYRNLGHKLGTYAGNHRHFSQLMIAVYNPNPFSVFSQMSSSASNLGGKRSEPETGVKNILEIYPGLDAPLYDNPIFIDLKPSDIEEGRVDIVLKYGLKAEKLDHVLRIHGGTVIDMTADPKRRFMWLPDPDSPKPIGMKGVELPYDSTTETPADALADKLRGARP